MRHAAFAVLFAVGSLAQAGPLDRFYVASASITEFGTLGGANSAAFDINNYGIMVGWAQDEFSIRRATMFDSATTPTNIGLAYASRSSEARGINNWNQVVGFYTAGTTNHAFRRSGTWTVSLADYESGYEFTPGSEAHAINDSGLIAGVRSFTYTTRPTPYLAGWDNATTWRHESIFTTLASHYTWTSRANDVNASGMVAGFDNDAGYAYRFQEIGGVVTRQRIPLPANTADTIYNPGDALGINDAGAIVGRVWRYDGPPGPARIQTRRAFYWNGNTTQSQELGTLPSGSNSEADDINSEYFIVGYSDVVIPLFGTYSVVRNAGFLRHPDFGMYRLPQPAGQISANCRATALNNRKVGLIQIAGTCDTAAGTRAVRWDVTVGIRITLPPPSF
jgi:uncharacterized membrane protein